MPANLIAFYRGVGTDSEQRRLDEILDWDDSALEEVHDFIQWLFPLPEASAFNPDAPLLTAADISEFRHDRALRANLLRAVRRTFAFYGFDLIDTADGVQVVPGSDFAERQHVLFGGFNHNHLRITRILKSLTLLGLGDVARQFLAAILANGRRQSLPRESVAFWTEAVETSGGRE